MATTEKKCGGNFVFTRALSDGAGGQTIFDCPSCPLANIIVRNSTFPQGIKRINALKNPLCSAGKLPPGRQA